jgi:hypothetical protein
MDNGSSLYHYYSFLNSAFFWYYPPFLLPAPARRRARLQLLRLEHFFLLRELNPLPNSGYESMLRAGMSAGFRNGAAAAGVDSSGSRLKGQLSFSSRQGSLMSQISEMGSEDLGGSSPEASGGGRGYIPGYPMGAGWEESPLMSENMSSGVKRQRESAEPAQVRPCRSVLQYRSLSYAPHTRTDDGLLDVAERAVPPVQPAQDLVGDGRHREVPPVPGRRALQDPGQARLRHAPPQHRGAGKIHPRSSSSPQLLVFD